jgi:hypothetical protein
MKYADLRAANRRLTEALERIHTEGGKVCEEFEVCEHRACQSSYTAWAISDAALRGLTPEEDNAKALRALYGEC